MNTRVKKNYSNGSIMFSRKCYFLAATLMMLAACQSEIIVPIKEDGITDIDQELKDNGNYITAPDITAVQETSNPTKSTLEVDGEGVGTIYWTPADEINVFYGTTSTHYVSQNATNATTAVFSTSDIIGIGEGETNIWGLYPYNSSATCDGSAVTTTLPATQYGVPGTFDDDLFITLAHNTSTSLTFYNVCGGIKFSLSRDDISTITFRGNNDEEIAGDISMNYVEGLPSVSIITGEKSITVTPKTGATFESGVYYYIVLRPITLSSGFTMTFETATEVGTFNYTSKPVSIKRSIFGKKDAIDSYASFISKPTLTDLSSSGTANCYIVSAAGDYKFDASVKGNSSESVGTVASVDVLWETFGTDVTPSVGDLVHSVSLNEGYVFFSATDAKGNALIAVKDSEGTILWSWHIWLVDSVEEDIFSNIYYPQYEIRAMMDRNLGAISKEKGDLGSYGLLYQWGRKDPFPGSSVLYSENQSVYSAKVSTSIREQWQSTISEPISEFARKNPDCFIKVNTYSSTDNWGGASSSTWNVEASKPIDDPCPVGYKMPLGGTFIDPPSVWYNSGFRSSARYDSVNHGWLMETSTGDDAWYPLCGIYPSSGAVSEKSCYYAGRVGKYWSGTINFGLYLSTSSVSYDENGTWGLKNIASGGSIRCQKE